MGKAVVLFSDKQDVSYEGVQVMGFHEGSVELSFPDGGLVLIAPGQWITAEFWAEEE